MSKRSAPPPDSGDLLNLPLDGNTSSRLEPQDLLPFETDDESSRPGSEASPGQRPDADPGFGDRFVAGLVDLGAVVGAVAVAAIGVLALGVRPGVTDLPAFAVFAASFSYLYIVVPLTFWARTPGMAFTSLIARGRDTTPLSIRQSFRRWLGAALTVALLGLPSLLTLTGASLADRLSDTRLRLSD